MRVFMRTYITVLWTYFNVFITILSIGLPKKKPGVIPVQLISMTIGRILAETSLEYCEELYVRKNLVEKPGASGSGRREDGSNDGGASRGGASGGRASGGGSNGGRSSGGRSSGEGASGSGASGYGTGGTGEEGCGGKGCGTYGGGATGCRYRRGETETFKTISLFTHIMTNEKSKSGSAAYFRELGIINRVYKWT